MTRLEYVKKFLPVKIYKKKDKEFCIYCPDDFGDNVPISFKACSKQCKDMEFSCDMCWDIQITIEEIAELFNLYFVEDC